MDNQADSTLFLKPVGEITGHFFVPDYQRGYRWGPEEVRLLLNDVWDNQDKNYCLQPIVVKSRGDGSFELIDGQQRLTTLFLIFRYLKTAKLKNFELPFSLEYQTRTDSAAYLATIEPADSQKNVDFYHMFAAYSCIEAWFVEGGRDKQLVADDMYRFLKRYVHVIWYEVEAGADSIALFTRLNIGRIPLTNSELVKALFLARPADQQGGVQKNEQYLRQVEIATQWDDIERDLHNPHYWAFLTNEPPSDYPTRIELIFDLMAGKKAKDKAGFQTFYHFKERLNAPLDQQRVWQDILRYALLLKEWYENRELYHRIGFLVHDGEDLANLELESNKSTKRQFIALLDAKITKRVNMSRADVEALEYGKNNDKIQKLLLLVNVDTVRRLKNSTERFPFDAHKRQKAWTLEHIHAQNAEGLTKKEQWQQWLRDHGAALASTDLHRVSSENESEKASLAAEIERTIEGIDKDAFETMARKISAILSSGDEADDMHGIANLALLSGDANSALSNSVFEVKRRKIIKLDRDGQYIPICTRMVFLKYYTGADAQHPHFWSAQDRTCYRAAILAVAEAYLKPDRDDGK